MHKTEKDEGVKYMTIRETMAMHICAGLVSNPVASKISIAKITEYSVVHADELIKALNKEPAK